MAKKTKVVSKKAKQQNRLKYVLFLVIGLLALFVTVAATQSQNPLITFPGAWDCAKYNFTVSQKGELSVRNDSNRAEPTTRVRVLINGVEVKSVQGTDLYAPALAAGQSAVIGMVPVPANGVFTWRAIAVKDTRCDDQGSYTQPLAPCDFVEIKLQ